MQERIKIGERRYDFQNRDGVLLRAVRSRPLTATANEGKSAFLIEPEAAGESLSKAIRMNRLDSRADLNPSARRRLLRNRRHGWVSPETRPCQRNGARRRSA